MRHGGEPITDAEALGVARRLARLAGRPVPDALATTGDRLIPAAYRLPGALLARARAKAEMEEITVTQVIADALTAYANSAPGSVVSYRLPPPRRAPRAVAVQQRRKPVAAPDPRFADARTLAERLGVPRARVLSWVRLARGRGTELEGPRSARWRSRTPVYDVAGVIAFGATVRRGRPRLDEGPDEVLDLRPRRQHRRPRPTPAVE